MRTEAVGTFVTVAVVVPDRLPLLAVIVAEPAAMPFSMPVEETVATAGFDETQLIVALAIGVPLWSSTSASNCDCWPIETLGEVVLILRDAALCAETSIRVLLMMPSTIALML